MARIDDDMLVCRCEEITVGEIREAIDLYIKLLDRLSLEPA